MLNYNQAVLSSLSEVIDTQETTEAFLLNFDGQTPPPVEEEMPEDEEIEQIPETYLPETEAGQVLYTFLLPPFSLSFEGEVNYDRKTAMYDTLGRLKFQSTSPLRLSLSNVTLQSPCRTLSVRSLIQELDNLRYPITEGAISPPSLALVIGQRVVQPLVLSSLSWEETNISEGEPVEARLSMQLLGFSRVTF